MKNSYVVCLVLIFWISLFTANILHIILLIFSVVFITRGEEGERKEMSSFRNRHWVWLVVYLDGVIMAKYLYGLHLYALSPMQEKIIQVLGLQYSYTTPLNLGMRDQDFASLTVLWVLYFFVVLQYETYKSSTYKVYSRVLQLIILLLAL
jgi:hypothetical protein